MADEILRESRRRQNPGDLSRDQLNKHHGYTSNVQKVLIENQKKLDQEEILRNMEQMQKENDELTERSALLR